MMRELTSLRTVRSEMTPEVRAVWQRFSEHLKEQYEEPTALGENPGPFNGANKESDNAQV